MTLTRGRIIKNATTATGVTLRETTATTSVIPTGRRIPKSEVDAHERAKEIVKSAEARAAEIAGNAKREGEEAAKAEFAAAYLLLRAREEAHEQASLARSVELAKVLAERLLGSALVAEPSVIFGMAEVALKEARGARRVTIEAHPLDAATLRSDISRITAMPIIAEVVAIEENDQLARGSLTLSTDLGTIDAKLAPQLERLGRALEDALRGERNR